mmetsp:Transcript_44300/g.96731  ORF Transcript_44300/g.96731 Transcript_44300/m.96731 type:complete len:235 (+) Transcript_44300:71-775(+)
MWARLCATGSLADDSAVHRCAARPKARRAALAGEKCQQSRGPGSAMHSLSMHLIWTTSRTSFFKCLELADEGGELLEGLGVLRARDVLASNLHERHALGDARLLRVAAGGEGLDEDRHLRVESHAEGLAVSHLDLLLLTAHGEGQNLAHVLLQPDGHGSGLDSLFNLLRNGLHHGLRLGLRSGSRLGGLGLLLRLLRHGGLGRRQVGHHDVLRIGVGLGIDAQIRAHGCKGVCF